MVFISALFLLVLLSSSKHATTTSAASSPPLQCDLYLAASTIPGAGVGIFSGVAKAEGDYIGNGDKAIPLVDTFWHNGYTEENQFHSLFDPTRDYVWDGVSMGMRLELFDTNQISAFWPGIDAMVNSHYGLLNLLKATPAYDEAGIHRSKHHGAGSTSPYDAGDVGSLVIRDIPVGGELFKSYGDSWFTYRHWLGNIPISTSYEEALNMMQVLKTENDGPTVSIPAPIMYDELVRPIKDIWDSRSLNAFFDFSWEEVKQAANAGDIGIHLQANATRSIDWLNENGKCLDHIVNKRSTIDGAGAGGFAKRDLPKGTIVTGSPMLLFPNITWFNMYNYQDCPDGTMVRNMTGGPYGHQLLLNYCFSHPDSTAVLCPYGVGVNYINHSRTRANVKVQWAKDGMPGHRDEFFKVPLETVTDYSTKVAFDYVATRDIAESEELFLDYGDIWEEKWNELRDQWQNFDRADLESYKSAREYNLIHENDYLLTLDELHEYNPYPDNLFTRCHGRLDDYTNVFNGTVEDLYDWYNNYGDNTGFPCEILERSEDNQYYNVQYVTHEEGAAPKTISPVPREAIKFFDKPYTTDIHMVGAFRQPIGMPDDMLPEAWRRTTSDDETGTDEKETIKDACAHYRLTKSHRPHRVSRVRT